MAFWPYEASGGDIDRMADLHDEYPRCPLEFISRFSEGDTAYAYPTIYSLIDYIETCREQVWQSTLAQAKEL